MQATVCPEMIQLKAPQRTQAAVREAARYPLPAIRPETMPTNHYSTWTPKAAGGWPMTVSNG